MTKSTALYLLTSITGLSQEQVEQDPEKALGWVLGFSSKFNQQATRAAIEAVAALNGAKTTLDQIARLVATSDLQDKLIENLRASIDREVNEKRKYRQALERMKVATFYTDVLDILREVIPE